MLMLIACSPEGAGASCARSACNSPATAGALPCRMTASTAKAAVPACLDLLWLPLGAGGHVVRCNGRGFEAVSALLQRAPPRTCTTRRSRSPGRSPPCDRTGARLGHGIARARRGLWRRGRRRPLGRWRLFRYEVRCWADGVIPDAAEAVDSPVPCRATRRGRAGCSTSSRACPRRRGDMTSSAPARCGTRTRSSPGCWRPAGTTSARSPRPGAAARRDGRRG